MSFPVSCCQRVTWLLAVGKGRLEVLKGLLITALLVVAKGLLAVTKWLLGYWRSPKGH